MKGHGPAPSKADSCTAAKYLRFIRALRRRAAKTLLGMAIGCLPYDTIYRALKDLGFSHVSARPKAYKQNAEPMDALARRDLPGTQ
jgi:hypothetical protein